MAAVLPPALAALGLLQIGQGAWMVAAPRSFYDLIADFGPYNPHDLRDMATWSLALRVLLLVAARRPAWRLPLLALLALEALLHALNHVRDADLARTTSMGVTDIVSLAALALLCAGLLMAGRREGGATP